MKIYRKSFFTILILLSIVLSIIPIASAAPATQTWTGYITTEDDFAAGLGADNAFMVYMKTMAMSGLGITYKENGKWVFLYFDGKISTGDTKGPDGKWMFDGEGSQLQAWNIVGEALKKAKYEPVPVTVTGVLNGDTATNPGLDKDGLYFPVITVSSMSAIEIDQTKAEVLDNSGNAIGTCPISFNKDTGVADISVTSDVLNSAFTATAADSLGVKTVEISVPRVDGAKSYVPSLPVSFLSTANALTQIRIKTVVASVTLPGNMLKPSDAAGAKNASVIFTVGDASKLSENMKAQLGTRPIINLNFQIDGKTAAWSAASPILVKLPYTRTAMEKTDVENITIWDLSSSGQEKPLLNGRYLPKGQAVIFNITQSGTYGICFTKKTFEDIEKYGWASKQIGVLAAKGIMNGSSATTFSPSGNVSKAEFVAMLVKTLGLRTAFGDNVKDVGKGLDITRQDMITITEMALKENGKASENAQISVLDKFSDKGDIADYAKMSAADLVEKGIISGKGDKLDPFSFTSRAEAAVIVYRLLSLYVMLPIQ